MAILAAMIVSSCQKEIEVTTDADEYILTASIDPDVSTRTALGSYFEGETEILWTTGDRIGVYADNAVEPALFNLISGEGSLVAKFSGPVPGTRFRAVYPWSIAGKADETGISLLLPEEQEYTPGTFAPGCFPMMAVSTTDRLSFKNLCAILKVSVTGHQSVTSLEFIPNDSTTVVSGPATASWVDGIPQLTMSPQGSNRVVLQTPGILLNKDTATDFYLVLPPQTYRGGFTVRIHTSSGFMDKVCGEDFTMERSRLHKATPFELKLDQGVEPSLQLEGKGTAEEPFLIGSLSDLLLMQATVNTVDGTLTDAAGTAVAARSAYYRLTTDIDLSPVCGAASGNNWIPIGNASANENLCFTGSFDGDGHTLSNLYIKQEKDFQGLFGLTITDTWPQIPGIITRLHVTGYVQGATHTGLIVGKGGIVSYCTGEGEVVSGSDNTGGIAGYLLKAAHCTNRASVRKTRGMTYATGGIAGIIESLCHDCINEGDITSVEGYEIGGIAGYATRTTIYNCTNAGTVTGGQQCGGIAGILYGSAENCINRETVSSGFGYSGGIVGVLDNYAAIRNCVNTARVTDREYGTDNGGICGYVRQYATIEYGYWPGAIPAVVEFNTPSSSPSIVFPFSQWQGKEAETVFMTTEEGYPCNSLIDAMNFWASKNRTKDKVFSGWEYDAELQTGVLTGNPAANPAGEDGFLTLLPAALETGADGGDYPIRIASSSGYGVVSAPDWIHFGAGTAIDSIPNNWMHTLTIDAHSGSRRTGVIVLGNAEGKSASVSVTQYGRDEFDWSQAFYHRSLFFAYTKAIDYFNLGTYAASYEAAYLEVQKVLPDRIVHAALFREGDLACPQSLSMFEQNGVDSWPRLYLDNFIRISNGSTEIAAQGIIDGYRTIESRKAWSSAQIRTERSGRNVKVDIQGYFKKASDYKVQVMLLEDGIPVEDGTCNDIVRVVLTRETGDPFTIQEDLSERSFSYNADVPSGYDLEKMHVLVFFQIPEEGSTYRVDNTFTAPIPSL